MPVIEAPKKMVTPRIPVDIYRNGQLTKSFDSLHECVRELHISYQTVKYLLATGRELYTESDSVTLDIPITCPYSVVLVQDRSKNRNFPAIRDDRTGELIG